MRVRTRIMALAAVVMVSGLIAGLVLFQPWKLVVDQRVNEALPELGGAPPATAAGVPAPTSATSPGPAAGPRVLYRTDTWRAYEHPTRGVVKVIRLAGGRTVLRLEGLNTSNGPDLKVWLSRASFTSGRFATTSRSLGTLKGNIGSSNYTIPAGADLADFRSVVIWCERFSVAFAAAPLTG